MVRQLESTMVFSLASLCLLIASNAVSGQDFKLSYPYQPDGETAEVGGWRQETNQDDPLLHEDFRLQLASFEPAEVGDEEAALAVEASTGDLAEAANSPTADLIQFQINSTFTGRTYEASGSAYSFTLQPVIPVKTGWEAAPTFIMRFTLPVIASAKTFPLQPDLSGEPDYACGLGDTTFISILAFPQSWGEFGIGPAAVFPTATDARLGERSWKLGPTVVVTTNKIPNLLLGAVAYYTFPMDGNGTQSFFFQPLLVHQLGEGWYHGWGIDLWQWNTDTGDWKMPLQWRVGKVVQVGNQPLNVFLQGLYTPDALREGPAAEWGVTLSIAPLFPG